MDITFTSFITTLIISSSIVLIMVFITSKLHWNKVISANIFIGLSIIFLVRLFIPIEFFFTYAVPSDKILPRVSEMMNKQVNILHCNISIMQGLIFIWILGSCIFFGRWLKSLYVINSLKKIFRRSVIGSYKSVKVATVNWPVSPVVIGLINSIIVIPDMDLSSEEKEFILEHELCHVNSLDLWIKYFYELLKIIYWWNPVLWVFRKHFNQMIELKADEFVIKNLSEKDKIRYVETLVKVGKHIQNYQNEVNPELSNLPSFSSSDEEFLLDRVNNIFYAKKEVNEKLVLLVSCFVGFYLSSCIIFEPYIEKVEIEQRYFVINKKNSFLEKSGKGLYKIYKDGKPLFEITEKQRTEEYGDLKIK